MFDLRSDSDPEAPERRVGPDECPARIDREALYVQFQPLAQSLVRRYGRTEELREDLPGEIYYRFSRLLETYDPERGIPVRAYMTRMLSQSIFNYVRDYWRHDSRVVLLDKPALWEALPGTIFEGDLTDPLVSEELQRHLPSAIARLPHRQRLVLVWRYYDERSFEEIAGELGIEPATARSLLRHAVAALRRWLMALGVA